MKNNVVTRLGALQDLAHRRLQDMVNYYKPDRIYVSYDDNEAVFWLSKVDKSTQMLECAYNALNDYDNVKVHVFYWERDSLPEDSYLCYKEGEWFF